VVGTSGFVGLIIPNKNYKSEIKFKKMIYFTLLALLKCAQSTTVVDCPSQKKTNFHHHSHKQIVKLSPQETCVIEGIESCCG